MVPEKDLIEVWQQLGPNAQHILHRLAQRLALGNKLYGDFPIRKWTKEAAEEALDLCVYLTAELEMASMEKATKRLSAKKKLRVTAAERTPKKKTRVKASRKTSGRANR